MAVALGVAHGLQGLINAQVLVKWPNDLWVRERKVGVF